MLHIKQDIKLDQNHPSKKIILIATITLKYQVNRGPNNQGGQKIVKINDWG